MSFIIRSFSRFQPTRPLRGATVEEAAQMARTRNFNPRAPCGARRVKAGLAFDICKFQPTRPLRGATSNMGIGYELEPISTHAPLAGRDNACCRCSSRRRNFNPRAPCGARRLHERQGHHCTYFNPRAPCGARQCKARFKVSFGAFQPTRPLRGATLSSNKTAFLQIFQPTRPLRGATRVDSEMQEGDGISTHAPLAGRDDCTVRAICKATGFQPTRPLRGATAAQDAGHDDRGNFNPRAPCGARRHYSRDGGIDNIFQPTRPLRGATFGCYLCFCR